MGKKQQLERCLKYVREINNPNKKKRKKKKGGRELFVVNQGIHLCFSHRKNPEAECCLFLQLYPINKHEAR